MGLWFMLSRFHCWNVLLMLDFNVQHEVGGFPHDSKTSYQHWQYQSTSASNIVHKTNGSQKQKKLKCSGLLLISHHHPKIQ